MAKPASRPVRKVREHDPRGRAARMDKSPHVAVESRGLKDPTVCDRCGAVFSKKTWRSDRKVGHALLQSAGWATCPGCEQAKAQVAHGRIILSGLGMLENEPAIRRRITNIASRAQHTQPERRVISVERVADEIEVLTTSQKLAHRIVHELKKAFGGRAAYHWDGKDGTLRATWSKA